MRDCAQVVPSAIPFGHLAENIQRLLKMPAVDIILCRTHMEIRLTLGTGSALSLTETSKTAKAAEAKAAEIRVCTSGRRIACAITIPKSPAAARAIAVSAAFFFMLNRIICLLDFFELLLRLCLIRIIDVGIRVVLPAQRAVSLLDFIIGRSAFQPKNDVWVSHMSPSGLESVRKQLSRLFYHIFCGLSGHIAIAGFRSSCKISLIRDPHKNQASFSAHPLPT